MCEEELKAAQQWNGAGVLNLIQTIPVFVSDCFSYCCTIVKSYNVIVYLDMFLDNGVNG